jgi:hypothetical protein
MTGKRGRPLKKVEPVNTDELPATQGYVKCIARKIYQHTHNNDVQYGWTICTALIAWMVILGVGMMQFLGCGYQSGCMYRNMIPSEIWYAIIAIAIVTTLVTADAYGTDNQDTNRPVYMEDIDKSIRKWKPEKCEEKEC